MEAGHTRGGPRRGFDMSPASAGFPPEAVEWLVGRSPARLLELGAGSGDLTSVLCALGHDVIATDPSPQLTAALRERAPTARIAVALATDLPFAASSVDSIVATGGLGGLDPVRTLPDIARVLGQRGVLAVIRRSGDSKVPWVRKLLGLVGVGWEPPPEDPFESSEVVTLLDQRSFRQWQRFDRATLVGFVSASRKAATLSPAERNDLLAEAGALYDSYGRGPDALLMPWLVTCHRGRVKGTAGVVTGQATDDGLLIDFN